MVSHVFPRAFQPLFAILLTTCGLWFSPRAQAFETTWDPSFNVPGADGYVYTMAETADDIYYGGGFRAIGPVAAANIIRFHKSDSTWHPLEEGTSGAVQKILVDGNDLYVGGTFLTAGPGTTVNYIAKWNGTSWSALGTGLGGGADFLLGVDDMVMYNGMLHVTGYFASAGGVTVNHVAKWNGTAWSALGTGLGSTTSSPSGAALAVLGADLYITGEFETAGGVTCKSIAKWDGSTWTGLHPNGLRGRGKALAVMGTDLYIGGDFDDAGPIFSSDHLAKWTGTAFAGVGGNMEDGVFALAVHGSTLYVGGEFVAAGGTPANRIAAWNGSSWSALGAGTNGDVHSLAVLSGTLHVGGAFCVAGTTAASGVARWTGSSWEALVAGKGLGAIGQSGSVSNMVDTGTKIYVGGSFITAGPVIANGIACFDKTTETWTALGTGLGLTGPEASFGSPYVSGLVVDGTNVYVGGFFNLVNGTAVKNIAKWDGASWSALGTGVNNSVTDMVMKGSDLYVTGYFYTAGGSAANGIAKWDGATWSALGSGVDGNSEITSVTVLGTDVIAGGDFDAIGGVAAKNIAKWNGTAWSPLGGGVDDDVRSLLASGGNLYAAGIFEKAGSLTVNNVAKWNGSAWSAMGTGVGYYPVTLAEGGTNIFIGGRFTSADNSPAQYMAAWNGTAWDPVAENLRGQGLPDPQVNAMIINGDKLYVGSTLIGAGNVAFGRFGKATLSPSTNKPLVALFGGTLPKTTSVSIAVIVNPKGLTTTATLHYGTTPTFGSTKSIPLSPANGNGAKTVLVPLTGLTPGAQYYYKAVASNSAGTSETAVSRFTLPSPPIIDIPPANQFAVQGTNVTLTAVVRGTPFLTYQWLKKAAPIVNARGSSLVMNNITLAQAGEYAVKVTNDYGSATSTPLAKLAVIDTAPKTVGVKEQTPLVLTAPAAGPGLTFAWYKGETKLKKSDLANRVTGFDTAKLTITKFTIADEDDYFCEVKLGDIQRSTGDITVKLQTPPQIDAVAAFAESWIVSGSVDVPITALITFTDSQAQNLPTKYVIAGLPTGLTYDGTTGRIFGKPTKSGPFKVKVTASNSAGTAPVEEINLSVASLDAPLVGVFNGLVDRSTDMNSNCGGTLNVTTTTGGGVSGKVVMAGKSYPLTAGALNATPGADATAQIPVKFGTVTLTLDISINRTSGELTGSLSDEDEGDYGSADVTAWRNRWSGKTPAETAKALSAYPFTAGLRMTSVTSSLSYPKGQGYGILTITKTGTATWKGQLADATTMTCSTTIGPHGEVPLHVMLYANTGSFQGWVKATGDNNAPESEFANNMLDNLSSQSVTWFKKVQPVKSTTRSYKDGIPEHFITVEGSAWPKPTGLLPLTGLSDASGSNNAVLTFSEGGVEGSSLADGDPLEQLLRIKSPNNAIGMPPAAQNPGAVTLTLNAATGEFKGAFTLKDNNPLQTSQKVTRTTSYYGLLVKRLGKGVGHFNLAKLPESLPGQTPSATTPTTSPMRSGKVELTPLNQ